MSLWGVGWKDLALMKQEDGEKTLPSPMQHAIQTTATRRLNPSFGYNSIGSEPLLWKGYSRMGESNFRTASGGPSSPKVEFTVQCLQGWAQSFKSVFRGGMGGVSMAVCTV